MGTVLAWQIDRGVDMEQNGDNGMERLPRQAREKGKILTYHIIQRGNGRKEIFLSDGDKKPNHRKFN